MYLVEAVHGDLRANTILMISDIAMITKTGNGRAVNLVVDHNRASRYAAAKVDLLARDQSLGDASTNAAASRKCGCPRSIPPTFA